MYKSTKIYVFQKYNLKTQKTILQHKLYMVKDLYLFINKSFMSTG